MGIPGLYRWVKERYPKCVEKAKEEEPDVNVNGVRLPIDTTTPNPNGIEFDNLFVDMNGIIHPCFHPEDIRAPSTYDEVFKAVFLYIDKLFSVVRPRKLLFLAIDGVAPRAKMNQQRSRRFRAAKDAADAALAEEEKSESSMLDQSKKLDSNVITPGTEFMDLLSSALRYYIHLRMNNDLGWRGIKVILSDASVPGEGEHKIMSYIRLQRNLPGYDPNTRHCLYGMDADLVMLALATHEIHFTILREDVKKSSSDKKNPPGNEVRLVHWLRLQEAKKMMNLEEYIKRQKFQFLHIWILREYLAHDMRIPDGNVEADLERLIDDFVFMCLFVGNDFLPQIPSLEISEGAINLLLKIYTNEFVKRGGYLTDSVMVNLKRVQHFLESVGKRECKIFRRRRLIQKKEKNARSQGLSNSKLVRDSPKLPHVNQNTETGRLSSSFERLAASVSQDSQKQLSGTETQSRSVKLTSFGRAAMINELGRYGGRARYYAEKFEAKTKYDWERIQRHAVFKYVEGICWVMRYYYEGVCSWQWFYPYHYAPCASDFIGIDQFEIQFTLGEPFKPFDQLMGVLPAASAHALPLFYRRLMTDASSPIFEFYPTDFELDMNGKHFSWQAICKLPFIEESRLLSEIAKVEHTLTDEERRRNSLGLDVLFIHISHPLAVEINSCCKEMNDDKKFLEFKVIQEIDPKLSGGMNGYTYISERAVWPAEIYSLIEGMKMIAKNEILSVFFMNPSFNTHVPRPMSGVILPAKSVCEQDVLPLDVLWRTKSACKKLSSRRKVSQRPVPESVSGPCLIKQDCLTETLQCTKFDDHVDAYGLEEPKLEVKSRKRKRIRDKQIEGIVPICSVQNMESYGAGGKREVDAFNIGSDKLVKFKIEEKSTNRKQIGSDSATGNISENLQRCDAELQTEGISDHLVVNRSKEVKTVYKSEKWKENEVEGVSNNNIEKLKGCVLREQSKGDDGYTVIDSLGEQKIEVKSKKKKQRYKKRKVTEGNGIPFISVEKLDSPRELGRGYTVGLQRIGEVNVNVKLESSSSGDQNKGCVGLLGINAEVKSKKRKRKSKKGKGSGGGDVPHKSAEKLECISSRELNKRDGNLAVAVGLQVASNVNTGGKLECSSHDEQNKGDGDQASAIGLQGVRTGENAGGLLGIIPEVKSRKRKNRSKKRKLSESDYVPSMSVEKLDSSISRETNKGDGVQVIAGGLQGARTGVTAADGKLESSSIGEQNQVDVDRVSAVGSLGVKTERKSRKTKHSSKKRKPSDGRSVPLKSVILDNSSLGEQNKEDGNLASAFGLQGVGNQLNGDGYEGDDIPHKC